MPYSVFAYRPVNQDANRKDQRYGLEHHGLSGVGEKEEGHQCSAVNEQRMIKIEVEDIMNIESEIRRITADAFPVWRHRHR